MTNTYLDSQKVRLKKVEDKMGLGGGSGYSEENISQRKLNLLTLCYHPDLKVYGNYFNIVSECDKVSTEEGLIKNFDKIDPQLSFPAGTEKTENEKGIQTVFLPESIKKYDGIEPIENKWYVRNLIKQGYKKV